MRLALLLAIGLLVAAAGAAQATHKQTQPVQPGPENDFGIVEWAPVYPETDGSPTPIEAHITLKEWDGADAMAYVLLAFNVKTDTVPVTLEEIRTGAGQDVSLHADDRDVEPMTPKVMVALEELPNGTAVLRGTVAADNNGRFHLGAMAIGFDDEFSKLSLPSGHSAEVYGSAEVTAEGVSAGGLAPPFEGDSNEVHLPSTGLPLALLLLTLTAWGFRAGTRRP